jgi:hypothetical protein
VLPLVLLRELLLELQLEQQLGDWVSQKLQIQRARYLHTLGNLLQSP